MAGSQVVDYMRLPTILKRYRFEDKLRHTETHSRKLMNPDVHGNPSKLRELLLPWELECFVSLSIKACEWKYDSLDETHFIQMMNGIRDAYHPELQKKEESSQFSLWFMMVTSATQFDYSESFWHKLYRCAYYFSYISDKINMPEEFLKKFGIDYQSVMTFSLALWIMYIAEAKDVSQGKREMMEKHPQIVSLLTMSRDSFIAELDSLTSDPMDYIYCLRPSYSFPFVSYKDETYLPLPHLLLRASTSSLMFRLTDGNDALREIVGLEVLESYLFHILSHYSEFEHIEKEIIYTKGALKNQRSADVMTSIGDQIICFDSKSFAPKVALRVFSEEALSAECIRLGKAVKQMYEQIHNKFGVEYKPFDVPVNEDRSNIWGIVVVSENPCIHLDDIYAEAVRQLKVDFSAEEYEWLQSHVGIVALSSIEYQVFSSNDILSVVKQNASTKRYNDHWFTNVKFVAETTEMKEFKKQQSSLAAQQLLSLPCVAKNQLILGRK